jgi:hypothetical protein
MHAVDLVSNCIVLLYNLLPCMMITYGLLICMHEEKVVMKRLLYCSVLDRRLFTAYIYTSIDRSDVWYD